jgi:hypothetical protein
MVTEKGLLFIEPKGSPTTEPCIDHYTRKVTAAIHACKEEGVLTLSGEFFPNVLTKGFHVCGCGNAASGNHDYKLPGGLITNSLAMHYLAYHRDEVPESELVKIEGLNCGEEIPTADELMGKTW